MIQRRAVRSAAAVLTTVGGADTAKHVTVRWRYPPTDTTPCAYAGIPATRSIRPTAVKSAVDTSNTLLNAAIGAVATVGLSFTAVSPVIGGAIAAYLEGDDGLRVGAISGVIALLPAVLVVLLGFVFFVGAGAAGGAVFVFLGVVLVGAWVVGLSVLGGYVGIYLREELS